MSIKKSIAIAATLLFVFQIQLTVSGQQFDKDATWVPESANVIAMVRMQDMLDSDLGKKEKWRSARYQSFKSGLATLPTSVDSLLIASQVDLDYMRPLYQVAVIKKKGDKIDLKKLKGRAKELALPVQFGTRPGLVMRSDAYLVQVSDNTLVSMEPANRQMTSRWLSKHDPSKTTVSPYLQDAIKFADSSSHFIFAMDLNDAIDVNRIKIRLANSPEKITNIDAVSATLASVKGVQMAIRVTDKINGAFKIDFKADMTPVIPYAKKFLIAALEKNGFMIDDFKEWELKSKPGALVLEGTLSNEGLNQIASFVENPLTKGVERAIATNQGAGDQQATMADTTKAYLGALEDYYQELMKKKGSSLTYKAKFLEKYAMQIDNQYSQNVDPIALDFGGNVSNAFREMSATLRQQEFARYNKQMRYSEQYENNAEAATQGARDNYNNWGGWQNNWGFHERYGKYTTEKVRDQKRINFTTQKEVDIKLSAMRLDIQQMYTATKQQLTKKYNTKF